MYIERCGANQILKVYVVSWTYDDFSDTGYSTKRIFSNVEAARAFAEQESKKDNCRIFDTVANPGIRVYDNGVAIEEWDVLDECPAPLPENHHLVRGEEKVYHWHETANGGYATFDDVGAEPPPTDDSVTDVLGAVNAMYERITGRKYEDDYPNGLTVA